MPNAKIDCVNREKNEKRCPCTAQCDKHALCCECVANHRQAGDLPACLRGNRG